MLTTAAASPAGGAMTVISRLERLDIILLCLEEIKAGRGGHGSLQLSSAVSTASSGVEELMKATDGGSFSESSLSGKKKGCRKMEEAIAEMQIKGSVIDRIAFLESRLLQLEENLELDRKREIQNMNDPNRSSQKKKHRGLTTIFKSWVKRKSQH